MRERRVVPRRLFTQIRFWAALVVVSVIGLARSTPAAQERPGGSGLFAKPRQAINFKQHIKPLLVQYCYDCHGNGKRKGDLALDAYHNEDAIRKDRQRWEKILKNLTSHEMPPEKKPQPSD